jgi:hypothetical protein
VPAGGVSPAVGVACQAEVESGGEVSAAGGYVTGGLGGQAEEVVGPARTLARRAPR